MHNLRTSLLLVVVVGVSVLVVSGIHGQLPEAFVSEGMLAVLCATAYPVSRFLFGRGAAAVIFAFPAGYILHSLLLSLAAWAFGFTPATLAVYMLVAIAVAAWLWRRTADETASLIPWDASDRNSLLLWLAVIIAITAPAFLNVGAETSNGFAYRAYFNTDVFRNMATAGSLARTGIPPENPYFSGHPMHYYWLFHVIPAFWTRILPQYRVEFLFVQFALATALAFGAALWTAARSLSFGSRATRWLLPLFVLGGSYEGLYVLNHLREKKMLWQQFTTLNVDGILRWVEKLPQVDTLFRPLLYAPQHLMAVIVFLMLFLLWPRASSTGRRLVLLVLVFTSVGFSVIVGALSVLAAAVLLGIEIFRKRPGAWIQVLGGGALGLCFLALYLKGYSMFSLGHGDLKFALGVSLRRLPGFFFFQWGAILLFGIAGIIFWKGKDIRYLLLCLFLLMSTIFVVFIQIEVPGLSDVSLKAGYIHHSVMLLFAARFVDQSLISYRKWLAVALGVAVLPASVTFLMDLYNSQDIGNAKFTSYVAKPQMEMYRWMRENLDPGVQVQDFFSANSTFIQSYVSETPPFSNRSVYLGDVILSQIFQTPKEELAVRRAITDNLVKSEDPRLISHLANKAGIEYLLAFPQRNNPLEAPAARRYFQLALEVEKWSLYRVLSNPSPLYHDRGDYLVFDDTKNVSVLTSYYEKGFHPVELLPDGEPARWMSQDGMIRIISERRFRGTLIFLTHTYARARSIELWWNGEKILSARVTRSPVKISFPVTILPGESEIRIHCPEGPEMGPGEDHRQLSLKIWELQFRPTG